MRILNRTTALTIVILTAVICFAQFSPKKTAANTNKCQESCAAACISDAEDVSLINLLTLKFM